MKIALSILALATWSAQGAASSAVRPAAIAPSVQMPVPRVNANLPFSRQRGTQPDVCRVRSFFGSDISKPLDVVYFARPGFGCTGYGPSYGLVLFAR